MYSVSPFCSQISTNNCTARYRTLSGGMGNSPSLSPSPSSDYEDIIGATRALPPSLAAKAKKNGAMATKSNTISQKATIHHVSISGSDDRNNVAFEYECGLKESIMH